MWISFIYNCRAWECHLHPVIPKLDTFRHTLVPVKLSWPKHRLGHPGNYSLLLSKIRIIGSKHPKKMFNSTFKEASLLGMSACGVHGQHRLSSNPSEAFEHSDNCSWKEIVLYQGFGKTLRPYAGSKAVSQTSWDGMRKVHVDDKELHPWRGLAKLWNDVLAGSCTTPSLYPRMPLPRMGESCECLHALNVSITLEQDWWNGGGASRVALRSAPTNPTPASWPRAA